MIRCKRCNHILSNPESIKRGYGHKCYRIMKYQEQSQKSNVDNEIQFLKCEINFLKRQVKELKINGFAYNGPVIERIKHDEHRPERDQFKVEFNVVVKELKIIFQGDKFDYHNILKPINPRSAPETPPMRIIDDLKLCEV